MDAAFDILKKSGQNNVDNLVKWMKSSNIVDAESEAKVRTLLKDADQKNVQLNEFQDAVQKLAGEQNKSLEEYSKQLVEHSESLMGAMQAGVINMLEKQFENLKKEGKNTVDHLVQWMKDSNIIDEKTEASARKLFQDVKDVENVELPKFEEALTKIAVEQKKNLEEVTKQLSNEGPKLVSKMEKEFQNLKKQGKNSVDDLVQWMKDSKIVDDKTEESARKLFQDCKDVKNVELPKFQEALTKLAQEQKTNLEDLNKQLGEKGPKLVNAFKAGVSAFKDAMK